MANLNADRRFPPPSKMPNTLVVPVPPTKRETDHFSKTVHIFNFGGAANVKNMSRPLQCTSVWIIYIWNLKNQSTYANPSLWDLESYLIRFPSCKTQAGFRLYWLISVIPKLRSAQTWGSPNNYTKTAGTISNKKYTCEGTVEMKVILCPLPRHKYGLIVW